MGSSSALPLQILRSYYPIVDTLGEYLEGAVALESGQLGLFHETDSRAYRRLLQTCLVASRGDRPVSRSMKVAPGMGHLREVVERAQIKLLTKPSGGNVMTAGYRLNPGRRGHSGPIGPPLENYFINTMTTVFEASEWIALYERLGTDIIFHLLTETSLFIGLPNDCYCQLTGEPIMNMKLPEGLTRDVANDPAHETADGGRKRSAQPHPDERPAKRLKLDQATTKHVLGNKATDSGVEKRTPADIPISRARLFFSRPTRSTRPERIAFGLPKHHVFNKVDALYPSSDPTQFDLRKQLEKARHTAKYIFPRQYGLPNPFVAQTQGREATYNVSDADREAQIKALGPCKTPKRLKDAVVLVERTIWRHSKCGYKALLDKMCPTKLRAKEHEPLNESVILEMMSETHSQALQTQPPWPSNEISVDSEGRSIVAAGVSFTTAQVRQKPRFAEFMCSYAEVFRFAVIVTKTVIPMAFWGSEYNFKLITKHIRTFIALRRYETLTLHHLLRRLRTSDCAWLASCVSPRQTRVAVSDALKRQALLADFVFWFFDGFLLPLLRAHFYVTESGAFRNRVLYFRHDDWETLCRPLVERLCGETFQKLSQHDAEEILRRRKLGFSFVRLLPKETGVRPIVNLRRKKTGTGQYAQSINQILKAAFLVLQYEKNTRAALFGASVLGPNELYMKMKGFKARLTQKYPHGNFPKLYFVKLDVQACFDTIEQTKLLSILRDVLSEDAYLIQRHGQVGVTTGHIHRRFVKRAMPAGDDHPHFLQHATRLADALRHVLFADQVTYPTVSRAEILEQLEQHITDNIVKIGSDYYRQVVGIPQGSVLSTLLCSFFYGDLEKRKLKFTDQQESVLLRLVDDYLYITTSLTDAQQFLSVMKKGHPEYGCFVSKEKTLTNFEDGTLGNIVDPAQRYFPWCGLLIDMRDLSVSKDYSRYNDTFLSDSLTVDRSRRPGARFTQKMLQLSQFTSHIIFSDPALNTADTVHRNIYQNFLISAMKMHHYIHSWKLDAEKHASFLLSTIHQMIRYTHSTMRNKAQGRVSRAVGGQFITERNVVVWLGTHAFHAVLSRKSHGYDRVLKSLAFELGLARSKRMRRRLGRTLKEAQGLFSVLSF
ncbi:telomerase reverse transcriptase [Phanerochaete sordida]|uniref:Telomerase reverse transcriptase n=1 Tax=Phanerochaete sordida TaxID=48140 RepID=A0A9P3LAR9_9APHY|nr:telomerase reverse transcriptase [Phanerochaete sordida]